MSVEISNEFDPSIPVYLPHEKVYSIQVGYKLFKLSGLSLSSDAPSYFTNYFSESANEEKVLFFDRNPMIFEKIYNHLQGYYIDVETDYQFVHLWSDCFYFGLKRLQSILCENDLFASVGHVSFKIPRNLFKPGNEENYFTMNYDRLLINNLNIIERKNMLRPPPQRPACVPNRSPKLFNDLLELLRGNDSVIGSTHHRELLIKECRYYRFLQLEQTIIPCSIVDDCIVVNLTNVSKSGLINESIDKSKEIPLKYQRPYMNDPIRDLIIQVNSNEVSKVKLIINKHSKIACVKFTNSHVQRFNQVMKKYIDNVSGEKNSLTFLSGFNNSRSIIDGIEMTPNWVNELLEIDQGNDVKKRRISDSCQGEIIEINLSKSLWKIVMRGNYSRLHAVMIEGSSSMEKAQFLP